MSHAPTDLLNSANDSVHRTALQELGGVLRFANRALEAEFLDNFIYQHRVHLRVGGVLLGVVLIAFFISLGLRLPNQYWHWAVSLRLALVLPPLIWLIWLSYQDRLFRYMQAAQTIVALSAVVAVNGGILLGHISGHSISYEGLFVLTACVYFPSWMLWWRAALVNFFSLCLFLPVMWFWQQSTTTFVFQGSLILTANLIGMVGCYFAEQNARHVYLAGALLQEMAERDGLTGLYNRRAFPGLVRRLWRKAQRDGDLIGVAMIDVDHFKRYNDAYGHPAGDLVLRRVAETLAGITKRPFDIAARYGGEEFALVFECKDSVDALVLLNRFRQGVVDLGIQNSKSEYGHLTVSCGVLVANPALVSKPETALHEADQALYEAKHGGRNRVVLRA